MVQRYPAYFHPANSKADHISGLGAYSSYAGSLDVQKLKKMGFAVNWVASFDFPYMGMFIPPLPAGSNWKSWYHKTTSTTLMDEYCRRMEDSGFHVLSYFNVTEFGSKIIFPPPPSATLEETSLWEDSNAYLYKKLGNSAILLGENCQPLRTWDHAVVVDPGDNACEDLWLEQAARHVQDIPHSSGICIDRLDWLTRFNFRADDKVTWVIAGTGKRNGFPVRALITSWKNIMSKLGPIIHNSQKAIFVNTLVKQLDLMKEIDGVYDEFGYYGFNLNQDSFLAVMKPVIAWTTNIKELQLQPDPDLYLQRHLFMGAFPMVPYEDNDHSILPDPQLEQFYMDYGLLFNELRGRKWVLIAHAVEVKGSNAKANVFKTPRGFAVAVAFGGTTNNATVLLRAVPPVKSPQNYRMEALLPGREDPVALKTSSKYPGTLAMTVPLSRGCAMVRLLHAKVDDGYR